MAARFRKTAIEGQRRLATRVRATAATFFGGGGTRVPLGGYEAYTGQATPHEDRFIDEVAIRVWTKHLGKSKEEIAAAIEKVGDNAESIKRNFQFQRRRKQRMKDHANGDCVLSDNHAREQ